MLHEVAASDLDVTHIVNPVRKMLRPCPLLPRRGGQSARSRQRRQSPLAHGADHHGARPSLGSPRPRPRLGHELLRPARPRRARAHDESRSPTRSSSAAGSSTTSKRPTTECAALQCQREPLLTLRRRGRRLRGRRDDPAALKDFVRHLAALLSEPRPREHVRMVLVHSGPRMPARARREARALRGTEAHRSRHRAAPRRARCPGWPRTRGVHLGRWDRDPGRRLVVWTAGNGARIRSSIRCAVEPRRAAVSW